MPEQFSPTDVVQAYQEFHEPGEPVGAEHLQDRLLRSFRHERPWPELPALKATCEALAKQRDDVKIWDGDTDAGYELFYISIGRPRTPEERFEHRRAQRQAHS